MMRNVSRVLGLIFRFAVLLLALDLGLATTARAQADNGVITGVITDTQGGVLPGVLLTVRNAESGVTRTSLSETNGRYRVAGVPPGRYNLTAELAGFATVEVKDITLTIGLEYPRDIRMGLSGVQESVTVTGQAPVVETTKTEVSVIVNQKQIESLPTGDRMAINLTLLLPGVGVDTTRPKRSATNIGAGISTSSTSYLVDGLSNAVAKSGEQRHDIPQAAIREFAVHTTQVPAEFGQRAGGVVSIATKSGTNDLHGEGFEFYRNTSLNRMSLFEQQQHDQLGTPKPEYRRHQFGAALGGPIIKDRLHFFGTYERTREYSNFTVNTGKPQFYSAFEGTFPGGSFTNIEFIRGDYQINDKQNLFYRYINQHTEFFCSGCGGTGSSFSAGDNLIPRDMHAVGHTWVLSNRVLNEFYFMRGTASDRTYINQDYTPQQYKQVVTAPLSLGGGQQLGSARYNFPSFGWGVSECLPPCLTGTQTTFTEAQEALSITTGNHNWKFGGSIQYFPTHEWASSNTLGTWTFSQDQYFNPADPNFSFATLKGASQFQASFPDVYRDIVHHTYAAYVTDEWKPVTRLTLNLGLRYDLQTGVWDENHTQSEYPKPLPYVDFGSRGDKNNVGPRIGLAWDLRNNGKSVLRTGYGLIYTNITNSVQGNEITTLKQSIINLRGPAYPDPYLGRDPATFASTAPPNISILANNLVNAPVHTGTVGFSQELVADTAVNVDVAYQKAVDYPTNVQINTPDPASVAAGKAVNPLPAWGQIIQTQPIGWYTYKALLVRLEKRLSHRYQYQLSYTLAKQDSNFSTGDTVGINLGGVITDLYNPGRDIGPAANDRRHAFVASGAAQLPSEIVLGVIWNFRTTTPFSARAGADLNGDGQNTGTPSAPSDYVPGTTKDMGNRDNAAMLAAVNAYRATLNLAPIPASQIDNTLFSRMDVRVSKAIQLGTGRRVELIGQVFNVLGHDNLGGVGSQTVTNVRSDSFGRILTSQPRQQGEVAVRFVW